MAEQQSAAQHHQTERLFTISRGGARLRRESGTACLAALMALFPEQHVAKKQRLVSISASADAPLATVEYTVQRSIISSPET